MLMNANKEKDVVHCLIQLQIHLQIYSKIN